MCVSYTVTQLNMGLFDFAAGFKNIKTTQIHRCQCKERILSQQANHNLSLKNILVFLRFLQRVDGLSEIGWEVQSFARDLE